MSGGELVLVVEDNRDVRSFVISVLTSYGFQVIEAGSGWRALQAETPDGYTLGAASKTLYGATYNTKGKVDYRNFDPVVMLCAANFGIMGLVGVCPGLGSIIALVTGNMAKGDIQRDPYRYTGDGLAKGGIILGWIGIGLAVCGLCAFVVWLLFFGGMVILGLSQPNNSWLPLVNGWLA